MRAVSIFFGTILLTGVGLTTLYAQETNVLPDEDIIEEYNTALSETIVPAIESMITSLEAQNAPVPPELIELLEHGSSIKTTEDVTLFEAQAERYFGEGWKEQIAEDASSLASQETTLAVRTRIYLSSLIINAEQIAKQSPLSTEEIRALGMEIIQQAQTMEEDTDIFFGVFEDGYAEIFPIDDQNDLASFRANVTVLLADIADALVLIVDGRDYEGLRADLADLQSRLQLVSGSQELTAWLARFDTFASRLLTHTIPTDWSLLKKDAGALLVNLAQYVSELDELGIETGTLPTAVASTRTHLAEVQTSVEFEVFLIELEILLTDVTETYGDSSSPDS